MSSNLITGLDLTRLPKRSTDPIDANANALTKAVIKNIQSRRSFTNGPDFIANVTTSVNTKFQGYTRNAVRLTVYRVLGKYFV
jgi:hypothetical protein